MYDTQVRLDGTILEAAIIGSVLNYETGDYYHYIDVAPNDRYKELELLEKIRLIKEEYLTNMETHERDQLDTSNKDKFWSPKHRCAFRFEVKQGFKISREGHFADYINDNQMLYQQCNILGNIQLLKDGNVFLSCRIIEPYYLPEVEESGEDDGGIF